MRAYLIAKLEQNYETQVRQIGALVQHPHLMEFHGVRLICSRLISPAVQREIATGHYEGDEILCALLNIEPDDVVLELGAGIGALSAVVLSRKKAAGWVCVEAHPDLLPIIRKNHKLNGLSGVELISGALSNDPAQTGHDFYVQEDFWDSSLLKPAKFVEVKRVPGFLFADILAKYRPTFIICDIEGGEYELFSGDIDLLCVRKVCLEAHAADSAKMNALAAFFADRGFALTPPPLRLGVNYWERKGGAECLTNA